MSMRSGRLKLAHGTGKYILQARCRCAVPAQYSPLKAGEKEPFKQPSPKKVMTMKARRNQTRIFLVSLLIVPILHWLISWVYINGSTIALAFQDRRGEFTLENFSEVWEMLFNPDKNISLTAALKNTVLTFLSEI